MKKDMKKTNEDKNLVADNKQVNKGRFQKGQSGNPSGRKKIPPEIKEMFKAAAPDAVRVLCQFVNDESQKPEVRIKSAEIILDRHLGKAVQSVDIDAKSIPQVVFIGADDLKE